MAIMTAQVLFNQLAYIDRLTRGGFSPEQARASTEALETAFSESVVTKSDFVDVKSELKADIASIRIEIAQSKNEILPWVFGFNLVMIGAFFGIIKFVH